MKRLCAAIPVLWLVFTQLAVLRAEGVATAVTSSSVDVESGVKLEVLDWGGVGHPVILLAALGADAHEFDGFAPKLARGHHLLGITRRGFGNSSKPETGYSNERLGHDIMVVLDAMHIERAVFVGHSMAGMELSWLASRHPERVAGVAYIEAAYGYAFFSPASSDPSNMLVEAVELRTLLAQSLPGGGRPDQHRLAAQLRASLARFEAELQEHEAMIQDFPDPPVDPAHPPQPPVWLTGIYGGLEKYTEIKVPALAIFAVPHALADLGDSDVLSKDPAKAAQAEAEDSRRVKSQADAFEHGVPGATVVRIPHASHFIMFGPNEADVLREVKAFLTRLSY